MLKQTNYELFSRQNGQSAFEFVAEISYIFVVLGNKVKVGVARHDGSFGVYELWKSLQLDSWSSYNGCYS